VTNKVKKYRKQLGLIQEKLAQRLSVTRQTINSMENNKYKPTLELAVNTAKFLGVSIEQLYFLD